MHSKTKLTILIDVFLGNLVLLLADDAQDAREHVPVARRSGILSSFLLGRIEVEVAEEAG